MSLPMGLMPLHSGGSEGSISEGRGVWSGYQGTTSVLVTLGGAGVWGAWTEVLGPQPNDFVIVRFEWGGAGTVGQVGYGSTSGAVTQVGAFSGAASTLLTMWPVTIPKGMRTYVRGMNPFGAGANGTIFSFIAEPNRALVRAGRKKATVTNAAIYATGVPFVADPGWGAWVEIAPAGLLTQGKRYKIINLARVVGDITGFQIGAGGTGAQVIVLTLTTDDVHLAQESSPNVALIDALAGDRRSGIQVTGGQLWIRAQHASGAGTLTISNPVFVEV